MSDSDKPREAELETATSNLNEGLKSCRAIISGYRMLLASSNQDNEPSPSDESTGESANESNPEPRNIIPT